MNIVFSFLLGFSPRSNKRPPFYVRVQFFMRVHALLTSPENVQKQFIQDHLSLVLLSLLEFLCCILVNYMPAECESLNSSFNLEPLLQQAPGSFDLFRQDHINTGTESWKFLTSAAKDSFERLTRLFRCKHKSNFANKKKLSFDVSHNELQKALAAHSIVPYSCHRNSRCSLENEYMILYPDIPSSVLFTLHSIIRIATLPKSILALQVCYFCSVERCLCITLLVF